MEEFPPLVIQANALARQVGFALTREEAGPDGTVPSCCLPGVGRILAVLAAGCHAGRIGEIGTGVGVGSAWMASSMPADCTLVTVEIDEARAAHASGLLASDGRIRVLAGDASELIPSHAPFDLLFADGTRPEHMEYASLIGLLRVGGQLVMDDVTPLEVLPADTPLPADNHRCPPTHHCGPATSSGPSSSAIRSWSRPRSSCPTCTTPC